MLSALVQAEEAGDHLSEAEMYSNAMLIIGAGHETTTNLIGNGLLALMRNPDQLQNLRDNPALLPNAVDEMLRYDSPVQLMPRLALDDLILHDEQIRKGQIVFLIFGAANRDPSIFSDPDRFDITRPDIKHLAFGAGIHFCLGASLARLEGQIALGSLIRRFPRLQLASKELHYRDNFTLHGVKALPVQF
jgi:pimeloyl-[acyl-carrier protein] synthase